MVTLKYNYPQLASLHPHQSQTPPHFDQLKVAILDCQDGIGAINSSRDKTSNRSYRSFVYSQKTALKSSSSS